ncbi:MAG: YceI family protein [Gammaproteobacteria bacterium]|nr:YceI family protein [Gammaproteobacteria bacterium]MBT8133205.1 YceI family protein [Gammaproteobacteria bacterium]NNJ50231.1 YceI family protein [Gammaproteobacteria bacterium]
MRAFILLSMLLISFPVFSHPHQQAQIDERICAPFRGGVVDPTIVKSMLQASEEGRLYRIQPKNSKVGFCVNSAVGRVEARFKGVEGGLALRKEVWGDRSQMLVMVDTNSLAMEKDYLQNMLKSEYFLDTYTYSKILFVSTRLWWRNPSNAFLEGDLTMHGVTKPIYFNVHISTVANQDPDSVADIVVTAKSFINRSDFDMDNLTMLVSDSVELCMRIEASLFKK